MADVKLVTKFVDLGSVGGYGFALYGFRNIGGSFGSFGTLSETANGSSNTTTSYLYSTSTDIKEVYWADQTTDTLYFTLDGNRSNSAFIWAKLKIGSTTFTRSTASYSYNSSTNRTTWSWATSTNPFGSTTSGTDVAIEVIIDVNTGHTSSTTSKTITAGSTSDETYTFANASSTQQYRLIKSSGTIASGGGAGTVIDSRTGGGNLIVDYSNNELPPAGNNATYQLQVSGPYVSTTETESGFWIDTTGQNNSFTITRQAASSTYSVTAPASINEGSAGTINVTTTNVSNGTTLYWDLDQSADYSTSQGSVSISSNAASFTITPTADSATEGAETDTIRLYTDSSRTTEVANDSFTINDTSTGSGGSSSGSDGSSTYGLQVTGPNGTTTVFSSNLRQMNAVLLASTTLTSQASVSYTGIAEATDSSKIAVVVSKQTPSYFENQGVTVARSTANGGTITLTNVSTSSVSIKVTIYRIA